jgi:hypothetical protein
MFSLFIKSAAFVTMSVGRQQTGFLVITSLHVFMRILLSYIAYEGAACLAAPSYFQRSAALHDPQQVQNDENDRDNDQKMDPTARLREARAYVPTEKAEQPQHYQNYDNSPQHEISPFE